MLRGGFVGVDVFFVISGYLITLLLLSDIRRDRFSIANFYRRRARRILPALTALLAATTAAALLLYSPAALADYGARLIGAAFFSANIQFLLEAGYFTPTAQELELLHLWSLAVEEQFYLVFPLLLWAGMRLLPGKGVVGLIVACLALSLIASIVVTHYDPAAAFYLLPTRAWELLIGAVLALRLLPPPGPRSASLFGITGLALLMAAFLLISESTAFPGVAALLPCGGAALIVHAGEGNRHGIASRLLATRPLVAIGLISYSLYLWHWPLLTIPTQYLGRDLIPLERALAVTAALLLAIASWKFVELPFRTVRGKPQRPRRPLTVAATTVVATAAAGAILVAGNGLPARVPDRLVRLEKTASEARHYFDTENERTCGRAKSKSACARTGPRVILWGDSHALQFAAGIRAEAGDLVRYGGPGCPPLLGVVPIRTPPNQPFDASPGASRRGNLCRDLNKRAFASITSNKGVELVVLGGAWQFFSEGIDPRTGEGRYLTWGDGGPLSTAQSRTILAHSLERTVDGLRARGITVLLLGDVPATREASIRCLARALMFGRSTDACTIPADQARRNLAFSTRLIASLSQRPGVHSFAPADDLCGRQTCAVLREGSLVFMDADHITPETARFLAASVRIGKQRLADFARRPETAR